jgi:hypothetical protein
MCRSLTRHRPQNRPQQCGDGDGAWTLAVRREARVCTVGTARRIRLTISAPPWRNVGSRCERVSLRSRRGMGRRRPSSVGSCPHTLRTYQINPQDVSAPPAAPLSLTSSLFNGFSSPSDVLDPPRFPHLITLHFALLPPSFTVLASPLSHTRPRFRLYALAKVNAGSPDTPTSKKMEKRVGGHGRVTNV